MAGKSSSDSSIYVLLTSPVTMATSAAFWMYLLYLSRGDRNVTIQCPVFSWENVFKWKMSRELQTTILYTEPKGKSTGRNKENMCFPRSLEGTLGIK